MNSYGLAPTTPSRWRVYQVPPPRHGRGGRIRTHDTRFWRPLLYQTELHPYYTKIINFLKCSKSYISRAKNGKLAQSQIIGYYARAVACTAANCYYVRTEQSIGHRGQDRPDDK